MSMQGYQGYGYSRSPAWVLVFLLFIVAVVSIISAQVSPIGPDLTPAPVYTATPQVFEPQRDLEVQKELDRIAVAQRAWRLADEMEKARIANLQALAAIASQKAAEARAEREQAARIQWMNAVVLIGAAATCIVFLLVARLVILSSLNGQRKAEEARREAEAARRKADEAYAERVRRYTLMLEHRARLLEAERQRQMMRASNEPEQSKDVHHAGQNDENEVILWPEQHDWLDENFPNLPLAE